MGLFGPSERRVREIVREEVTLAVSRVQTQVNRAEGEAHDAVLGVGKLLSAKYKLVDDKGDEVSLDLGGPNVTLRVVRIPE